MIDLISPLNIGIEMLFKIIFICILSVIMIIDIYYLYIPNFLTLTLIILGLFYNYRVEGSIESSVLGMGYYSLLFALIYGYISDWMNKEVLGYGDIKLTMGIGAYLGYTNLLAGYLFFTLCFFLGSIYCVYILIRKKNKKNEIPFAPFIVLSTFIILYYRS